MAGPSEFTPGSIHGAQFVVRARFAENIAGIRKQRMRMLIVLGNAGALVDASANNMTTWQGALPALNAMS